MRVCFLQNDPFVKQGVLVLAAFLVQRGHRPLVLIESEERDLTGTINAFRPGLFAFSVSGGSEKWLEERVHALKEHHDVPIVVGGSSPTISPEMIERIPVDYLCRGEGVYPLAELCDALDGGQDDTEIENVWTRKKETVFRNDLRPLMADLDELPVPAWEIYFDRYPFLRAYSRHLFSLTTGWGCTETCRYCFHSVMRKIYAGKGKYIRRKSSDRVLAEILEAKRRYDIRRIKFEDDDFFSSLEWLREFEKAYKRDVSLPFDCLTMASRVDKERLDIVRSMGCASIIIGVETANADIRKGILGKQETDEELERSVHLLKQAGIRVQTDNIYGTPGENAERALRTYDFNRKHRVDFAHCSFLQPYPGSAISDSLEDKDRSTSDSAPDLSPVPESHEYFYELAFDVEDKNEIMNLQRLTQFALMLRIPTRWMKRVIHLPHNRIFNWIFSITFALGYRKVKGIPWIPFIRMGWHARGKI